MRLLGFVFILLAHSIYHLNCRPSDELWKEKCQTEEPSSLCGDHELVDFCGLLQYCGSRGLLKRDVPEANQSTVSLSFYYEARCPFSIFFLMGSLVPAFTRLYGTGILDVDMIPFGFAALEDTNGTMLYKCQHGPEECYGNRLHACAMDMLIETSYVPFIGCLGPRGSTKGSAKACGRGLHINVTEILSCANGTKGEELFQEMADKTEQLKPKFKTLPWVLFNGIYNENMYEAAKNNSVEVICNLYNGPSPRVCRDIKLSANDTG